LLLHYLESIQHFRLFFSARAHCFVL